MSQHSTASNAAAATKESSAKPGSSATGSLKKQKSKDGEVTLTDDFVLMSTPEKFKDKNISESNAVEISRNDSFPNDKTRLDCLLLSDTSEQCGIPQHVQNLLQQYENIQLRQAEILFILVYIVALESGFIAQCYYEQAKTYVDLLPPTCSFHAKNILRLSRLKPSYKEEADKTRFTLKLCSLIDAEHKCSDYTYGLLTAFVTGDFFIITLSPANSTGAKGFSTSLSIGRYILSMHAKNKPVYLRFRKLDELTNILRDKLFVPMRCQHVIWLECSIYPSLDGMPAELYDEILKYLSKNQLRILANVNKSLYNLTKSSKFLQESTINLR